MGNQRSIEKELVTVMEGVEAMKAQEGGPQQFEKAVKVQLEYVNG